MSLFKKNDWQVVWVAKENRPYVEYNLLFNSTPIYGNDVYVYEILYSPSRKKYKLKMNKDDGKELETYTLAVYKLLLFQKEIK